MQDIQFPLWKDAYHMKKCDSQNAQLKLLILQIGRNVRLEEPLTLLRKVTKLEAVIYHKAHSAKETFLLDFLKFLKLIQQNVKKILKKCFLIGSIK